MVSVVAQPVSKATTSSTASSENGLSDLALSVIMAVPRRLIQLLGIFLLFVNFRQYIRNESIVTFFFDNGSIFSPFQ